MPLNFPSERDVPLKKAPLGEVICQVRFPPVLRLRKEPPADIQDAIGSRFPQVEILEPDEEDGPLYRLVTQDGLAAATISSSTFALATKRYTVWADFAENLDVIQRAMHGNYAIPFYYRVGLRYVNFFSPANTAASTLAEISEVLRPELTALLRSPAWSDPPELLTQMQLRDSDRNLVIRVGALASPDEGGPVVTLDLDCYQAGQIPVNHLIERCEGFHNLIYDAFRWALNSGKLALFEPIEEGVRT